MRNRYQFVVTFSDSHNAFRSLSKTFAKVADAIDVAALLCFAAGKADVTGVSDRQFLSGIKRFYCQSVSTCDALKTWTVRIDRQPARAHGRFASGYVDGDRIALHPGTDQWDAGHTLRDSGLDWPRMDSL